ncbi:hypothetical protein LNKW23_06960 [Paralimibaculum aggregatum]|uniref:TfoX N-terminal domain-containing protein n=1 Tax=Paralimibaculum aggregatum TaxID=3036245 RepID=A0ABQ6LDP9_9RHOB|nr:hypothetical protein [Limibaculum sp. NKW23]GMG81483.1 hypothetical protein LNKW23_06960 [Limibaculum sp. NKW23]
MAARIAVRNGSVYLGHQAVATYFGGITAIIVLIRDGQLQILPVRQMAAGGCLLKIRNARGDRVASAPDVFAEHGLLAWQADDLEAVWSAEVGALVADLPAN